MSKPLLTVALSLSLVGMSCTQAASDPTVPPEYLAPEWMLVAIDGQAFGARATIDFSEPGRVTGEAPCNRWFAGQPGTLPDLKITGIGATRMACPDLGAEQAFFEALEQMTRAEITGPVNMTLTGEKGGTMEFVRPLN
ncbi:META domain-containing protein [Aliigemmobacter aestuarii]|nr:META domain-containing protein [Gemmobacter aestuarii]